MTSLSSNTPLKPTPQFLELVHLVQRTEPHGTLTVAIDPGDIHVGIAIGRCLPTTKKQSEPTVLHTVELTQAEALYFAHLCFPMLRSVVIEQFSLYADKAKSLIGSTMPTCRLIGALEYIACISVEGTYAQPRAIRSIDDYLFEQPASVQEPTRAKLRARGTSSHAVTNKTGPHCLSAELHFYHFAYSHFAATPASTKKAARPFAN